MFGRKADGLLIFITNCSCSGKSIWSFELRVTGTKIGELCAQRRDDSKKTDLPVMFHCDHSLAMNSENRSCSSGISVDSSPSSSPMNNDANNDISLRMAACMLNDASSPNHPSTSAAGSSCDPSPSSSPPSQQPVPVAHPTFNPHAAVFVPRAGAQIDTSENIDIPEWVNALAEQEKRVYLFHRVAEEMNHAFTSHYTTMNRSKRREHLPMGAARTILEDFTHSNSLEFMAMTRVWERRSAPTIELPCPTVESVPQFPTVKGVKGIYRVIKFEEDAKRYILLACHMNLHGLHRGDLRFVEVNGRTRAHGFNQSTIGVLAIGDIIAVSELARTAATDLDAYKISEVTDETPPFWMVVRMTVINRVFFTGLPLTILSNKTAVVEHFSEVMTVQFANYLQSDATSKIYLGSGLVPVRVQNEFSKGFNRWNALHSMTAGIKKYPNSMGIVTKYTVSDDLSALYECGTKAFAQSTLDAVTVAELCSTMGSSAVNAIQKGRFDSRSFKMLQPSREGELLKFSIRNPSDQPTRGLWKPNTRLTVGGTIDTADAVIETVLEKGKLLEIVARLSRQHNWFQFTEGTHMVAQADVPEAKGLSANFLQKLPQGSNGRYIIEVLYGRQPIDFNRKQRGPDFIFPSQTPIVLNAYQSDYVDRIVKGTPLTIANAPFGCGKSVTIVTAALNSIFYKRIAHQESCVLLVTQSNFAAVNLVDILQKALPYCAGFRAVRYLSERNWNELPDDSRTMLDFPVQLADLCHRCVIGASHCPSDEALIHCLGYLAYRQMVPNHLLTDRARFYADARNRPFHGFNFDFLIHFYIVMTKPEIIVVTADSLPLIAHEFSNVTCIQFDEASQLPECAFLKIVSMFPHACFGLVGDVHQLPPYSDRELTGYLKDFGIGNTMERCVRDALFPQANLEIVYRCHPLTTQLLGNMFYGAALKSGVTSMERETYMNARPDIWRNPRYPIAIINNPTQSYKMGTSVANTREAQIVDHLVVSLINPLNGAPAIPPQSIGIISFYKAQATILTERYRKYGIKCGTVDSFQGSEREVMILCTTNNFVSGFMTCEKRINVAFSRAKQSTIVIGNIEILKCSHYWQTLVNEAAKNDSLYF